jgi:hypothetical protein
MTTSITVIESSSVPTCSLTLDPSVKPQETDVESTSSFDDDHPQSTPSWLLTPPRSVEHSPSMPSTTTGVIAPDDMAKLCLPSPSIEPQINATKPQVHYESSEIALVPNCPSDKLISTANSVANVLAAVVATAAVKGPISPIVALSTMQNRGANTNNGTVVPPKTCNTANNSKKWFKKPTPKSGNDDFDQPNNSAASLEPTVEVRNGVEWVSFVYSNNRTLKRYTCRTDLDSVNIADMDEDFKSANCVSSDNFLYFFAKTTWRGGFLMGKPSNSKFASTHYDIETKRRNKPRATAQECET